MKRIPLFVWIVPAMISILAGPARAQCPVSWGVWLGQAGAQRVAFRITSTGMVVDSVAVEVFSVCGQSHYSATDETPTVVLQCSPAGFEWSHCRESPPSSQGFRLNVTFDAFDHATARLDYLTFGCNGGECLVADFADVTPVDPADPPSPAFACSYLGGGTVEYGITNGGSGVLFDVETTAYGTIDLVTQPVDLIGPDDTRTFLVGCAGAGRGGVTLLVQSGGQLVGGCTECFDCAGSGATPVEVDCFEPGAPVPSASPAAVAALIAALAVFGLLAVRRRLRPLG